MARIFITGIEGFVGGHLAACLGAAGHEVTGSYLKTRPALEGVELVSASVLDSEAIRQEIEAAAPDVVIHLAGLSHVGRSWKAPGAYFAVNVLGTERVLDALPEGTRMVLASSAEVYGPVPVAELPIAEEREVSPATPYGLTKAAAERLCLARGAIVVRSFNLIGPGQSTEFALPSFAEQLAEMARGGREPVLRVGNLEAERDFLHVRDGAAAYMAVALEGEPGSVYNLASGEAVSIRRALDLLLEVSGVEAHIELDPERMRPSDNPRVVGQAERLRSLGWSPALGLDRAVRDLWEKSLAAT